MILKVRGGSRRFEEVQQSRRTSEKARESQRRSEKVGESMEKVGNGIKTRETLLFCDRAQWMEKRKRNKEKDLGEARLPYQESPTVSCFFIIFPTCSYLFIIFQTCS